MKCPKRYVHDWRSCPFAHPTENARRRDPREVKYMPVPCPDYKCGLCLMVRPTSCQDVLQIESWTLSTCYGHAASCCNKSMHHHHQQHHHQLKTCFWSETTILDWQSTSYRSHVSVCMLETLHSADDCSAVTYSNVRSWMLLDTEFAW